MGPLIGSVLQGKAPSAKCRSIAPSLAQEGKSVAAVARKANSESESESTGKNWSESKIESLLIQVNFHPAQEGKSVAIIARKD